MSVETYSSAKQKIEKEILRLQKQMKSLRVKQRRPVIASIVKSMQDNEITIEEVAEALENSARRGAGRGAPPVRRRGHLRAADRGCAMTTTQPAVLLEHYLKQLKLPTILREYARLAAPRTAAVDAATWWRAPRR